ncbi:hypothetical protein SAMN02745166_02211 [Prosthecobacter debontii]|uniref:Uncharacterized protein n=1 Tax=Prosthecobacter debontii TaxID=48467 RepID=A0A1T4Y0K3_9BACT|nr:hypothetical protein [Prosthecobacter debontii]SKA94811.1 hypothetical protein SAMN02745166_02211 [Prosthecobacter debontii]
MSPTDLLLFAQTSGLALRYDTSGYEWQANLGRDIATGPTPSEAIEALHAKITYRPPPPKYTWMRSLHHDWAHLVGEEDGIALCSARIPHASLWHPAEETRRCKRCQGQAKEQGVTVVGEGETSQQLEGKVQGSSAGGSNFELPSGTSETTRSIGTRA